MDSKKFIIILMFLIVIYNFGRFVNFLVIWFWIVLFNVF